MICENCKKEYFDDYRSESQKRRAKSRFCCRSCAATFNSKKAERVSIKKECTICHRLVDVRGYSKHLNVCDGIPTLKKEQHCSLKGRTYEEIYGEARAKEFRVKLSEKMKTITSFRKIVWDDKRRQEQSERKKQLYQEHPEKHPNRKLANNKNKMSYPEKVAYDWLLNHKILFEHQYKVERYYVDFYLPNQNMIIEIDGEYWHDTEHDKERDKIINEKCNALIIRIRAKERIENRLDEVLANANI